MNNSVALGLIAAAVVSLFLDGHVWRPWPLHDVSSQNPKTV